jgi:hypothetical protein
MSGIHLLERSIAKKRIRASQPLWHPLCQNGYVCGAHNILCCGSLENER